AASFGIAPSNVSKWVSAEQRKARATALEGQGSHAEKKVKQSKERFNLRLPSKRDSKHPDVENKLWDLFRRRRNDSHGVSARWLRVTYTKLLREKMPRAGFVSLSTVHRFARRYKIVPRKAT